MSGCVLFFVKLRNRQILNSGIGPSFALCLFLFIGCVVAPPPSYAEGKNLVFRNSSPDRTWTGQVGGLLTPAKSYALVISVSDYIGKEKGGYPKLGTSNDAEKMKNFLLQDMGFDYVKVVTDTEVTKASIEAIMVDEIRPLVGPNDRFVFYWSGHGDQLVKADRSSTFGFLPLYNSKVGQFSSMVGMEDIARWNGYLEARHALFILDSCLSGLAGVNRKSNPRLNQLSLPARFLITAGAANEEVIAGDQWGGSLFTDLLIRVVRQQAQASGSTISIYKVFDEIQERVAIERQKVRWSKQLTPQLRDLQGGDGAFFFVTRPIIMQPSKLESKEALVEKGPATPNNESPRTPTRSPLLSQPSRAGEDAVKSGSPTAASESAGGSKQQASVVRPQNSPNPPKESDFQNQYVSKNCRTANQVFDQVFISMAYAVAPEDAIKSNLDPRTPSLLSYRAASVGSSAKTYDWPDLLRGSFQVVASKSTECGGKATIIREDVIYQDRIVAVVYSYQYTPSRAAEGTLRCAHNSDRYDLKGAFDGIKAATHERTAWRPSAYFHPSGYFNVADSVFGLKEEASATDADDRRKICTDYLVRAAKGYQ